MTTEQTEDEFTKKRRIDTLANEGAHHATNGARVFEEMRRLGMNPTAIMKEVAKHVPEMLSERATATIPALGFCIESLRLAISGGSREEEMQLVASMSAISGVKVTVRDEDGYVIDGPTPEQTREALRRAHKQDAEPPSSWATIQRLFKENPSPLPDQAPAFACGVMLRGVPMTLEGALSETPEGGLRLLSRGSAIPGGGISMVEQFFDYEDVMVVAVQRSVTTDSPRIIRSS